MPKAVKAYKCDYCNKLCHFLWTALRHEASCRNNPKARHCITCIHGISACIRIEGDWQDFDGPGTEVYGPYCGYHNKPISDKPYLIDCDMGGGFSTGIGYHPEFPHPYTCHHYKSKGKAEWTTENQYAPEEGEE